MCFSDYDSLKYRPWKNTHRGLCLMEFLLVKWCDFFFSQTDQSSPAAPCPFLQFSIFGSRTAGRPIRCVGDDGARYGLSKAEFMEKVQQSNEACQRGDFQAAVHLYSDALQVDSQNCILYSNRSAAFLKLGQHQAALEDAEKACELNPKWPKVSAPQQPKKLWILRLFF